MAYYVSIPNGGSWVGETIHADADCPTLADETPVRPVGETSVDQRSDDVEWCSDCVPFGDDAESDTCDVVKSDGEVCGRELPCQYHS